MTLKISLVLCLALSGCQNMNLASTIAGGACGSVDYTIMFMGNHLLGIKADRQCIETTNKQEEL